MLSIRKSFIIMQQMLIKDNKLKHYAVAIDFSYVLYIIKMVVAIIN